jgi:hypothetical protein
VYSLVLEYLKFVLQFNLSFLKLYVLMVTCKGITFKIGNNLDDKWSSNGQTNKMLQILRNQATKIQFDLEENLIT